MDVQPPSARGHSETASTPWDQAATFRAIVNQIPQFVWTATPDGYHDYFNDRWYEYTGMSREGEEGWNWKDFLHPDDYDRTLEIWQHSLETGEPYEVEYRFRRAEDGAYRWFIGRAMPLRDEEGRVVRWFGTCTDVHAERIARMEARRSEDRYRAVTRATNDAVWEWDTRTDVLWWNENVRRVFGLNPDEVSRMELWVGRVHPEDKERVLASLEAALDEENGLWAEEYRFRKSDDTYAAVLDQGLVVRDETGAPRSMVGAMEDITQRKRMEEELRRTQKLEAVGKLAGGIAHDFNNLLTVMASSAKLAGRALPEDSPVHHDLLEISRATERAAGLTRQLLAFSRRQVLQFMELDLNEIVTGTRGMLARLLNESISVEFSSDPDLRTVRADRGQLEQVIMNLTLNARDAMPNGGTLTLRTRNESVTDGQARSHRDVAPGHYVRLSVTDTGAGMAEKTRERAFEPFFTTKDVDQGTGLGLPTVQGIVGQSGGFVEMESQPGEGTTVHVYLPAQNTEATPDARASLQQPSDAPASVILVVEDQESVRRVARRALARKGHTVVEAANGREALELLRQEDLAVDLVVTDLVMPEMGGRELVTRARDDRLEVPFLFMSGYAEDEILREVRGDDPPNLLQKPFTPDELNGAVAARLSEVRDGC